MRVTRKHENGRKLNLGCGRFKKEGYLNVDCNQLNHPDILHDLNVMPYPFPDNHFDIVEADHIIEHLDSPFDVMREIHRVLKDDGRLAVRVSHFSRGFTHPEHRRGFDVSFPYYFKPSFQGGYTGVEFDCKKTKLTWFAQPYLKKTVLSPFAYYTGFTLGKIIDFFANLFPLCCSRLWCFSVGGFEEVEFYFICKKSRGGSADK